MFNAIEMDRSNLTIMGIPFSDLKTLESTANALGSNMFEGYKPTPKGIEIIRDYVMGKISLTELVAFANQKAYVWFVQLHRSRLYLHRSQDGLKFTEEKLEKAFTELLGQEGFTDHLGNTITRKPRTNW